MLTNWALLGVARLPPFKMLYVVSIWKWRSVCSTKSASKIVKNQKWSCSGQWTVIELSVFGCRRWSCTCHCYRKQCRYRENSVKPITNDCNCNCNCNCRASHEPSSNYWHWSASGRKESFPPCQTGTWCNKHTQPRFRENQLQWTRHSVFLARPPVYYTTYYCKVEPVKRPRNFNTLVNPP